MAIERLVSPFRSQGHARPLGLAPEELEALGPLPVKAGVYALRLSRDYGVSLGLSGYLMGQVRNPEKHYHVLKGILEQSETPLLNDVFKGIAKQYGECLKPLDRDTVLSPDGIVGRYHSILPASELEGGRRVREPLQQRLPENVPAPAMDVGELYESLSGRGDILAIAREHGIDRFFAETFAEIDLHRTGPALSIISRGLSPQRTLDLMATLNEENYRLLFTAAHTLRPSRLEEVADRFRAYAWEDVPVGKPLGPVN